MDYKTALGALSVIFALLQYGPYIRDVLRNKTKPHAFSWFVWSLPSGIVFAAQLVKGGEAGAWASGVSTFLCTIIFILCFWRGEKNITRLDVVALLLGLVAIALWIITDDPFDAVVLTTVADLIGFVPTVRKSVAKPYEETASTYLVSVIKWTLSILALGSMSATNVIYPLAMIISNAAMVFFLFYRRKQIADKL